MSKWFSALLLVALAAVGGPAPGADGATGEAQIVVLVAGASGRTGKHAVAYLRERGIHVRALTRNPDKARDNVSADYDWVRGDVGDPQSLDAALEGVTHVIGAMGSSSRDPSNSPEGVDHLGVVNLTDAAKRAGVKHVILISAMGVTRTDAMEPGHMRNLLALKLKGEDYLRASGVNYTVIRPGGLDTSPAGEDGLAISQGDGGGSGMLSRQDLARVAIECLTNPAALNKTFEITGSKAGDPDAWREDLRGLQ